MFMLTAFVPGLLLFLENFGNPWAFAAHSSTSTRKHCGPFASYCAFFHHVCNFSSQPRQSQRLGAAGSNPGMILHRLIIATTAQ